MSVDESLALSAAISSALSSTVTEAAVQGEGLERAEGKLRLIDKTLNTAESLLNGVVGGVVSDYLFNPLVSLISAPVAALMPSSSTSAQSTAALASTSSAPAADPSVDVSTVTASFETVKINSYGRRQVRTLKIHPSGVLRCELDKIKENILFTTIQKVQVSSPISFVLHYAREGEAVTADYYECDATRNFLKELIRVSSRRLRVGFPLVYDQGVPRFEGVELDQVKPGFIGKQVSTTSDESSKIIILANVVEDIAAQAKVLRAEIEAQRSRVDRMEKQLVFTTEKSREVTAKMNQM